LAFLCLPQGFRRGNICAFEMRFRTDLLPLKKILIHINFT